MRRCDPLGFWVPDGPCGDTIIEADLPGKPRYNRETALACIEACGNRRATAIDGGAYIGTFSAHIVGSFQRVIAFEPMRASFECLRRNMPRVECHNTALSGSSESVMVGQERGRKTYQWRVGGQANAIAVPGQAIDDLGLADLDLLKLDVEGHEHAALLGAAKTIARCRPVILIEEKLDPEKRASALLLEWGMTMQGQWKYDLLFVWP